MTRETETIGLDWLFEVVVDLYSDPRVGETAGIRRSFRFLHASEVRGPIDPIRQPTIHWLLRDFCASDVLVLKCRDEGQLPWGPKRSKKNKLACFGAVIPAFVQLASALRLSTGRALSGACITPS